MSNPSILSSLAFLWLKLNFRKPKKKPDGCWPNPQTNVASGVMACGLAPIWRPVAIFLPGKCSQSCAAHLMAIEPTKGGRGVKSRVSPGAVITRVVFLFFTTSCHSDQGREASCHSESQGQ